jgi:hypothetical protein
MFYPPNLAPRESYSHSFVISITSSYSDSPSSTSDPAFIKLLIAYCTLDLTGVLCFLLLPAPATFNTALFSPFCILLSLNFLAWKHSTAVISLGIPFSTEPLSSPHPLLTYSCQKTPVLFHLIFGPFCCPPRHCLPCSVHAHYVPDPWKLTYLFFYLKELFKNYLKKLFKNSEFCFAALHTFPWTMAS